MTTQGHPKILAAMALAAAASGCLVEHGNLRGEEPDAPVSVFSPSSSDYDAPREQAYDSRASDVQPGAEMSEDAFYDRLSPYGSWRTTADYGRVWVPAGVGADFQPYSDGHWALSDWGWTYVSDAPWGWAAYHYGRWGYGGGLGWYWIPGRTWGPAWVSWRYGGGYVAWAPLGPGGYYYGSHSRAWVAMQEQHFTQPIRSYAVPAHRTAGVVASAAPQASLARPQRISAGGVIAGPSVAGISRATGRPLQPTPVGQLLPRGGAVNRTPTYGTARPYASSRVGQAAPRAYPSDRYNRSVQPGNRWGGPSRSGAAAAPRGGPSRTYGSGGGYSPRASGSGGYSPRASGSGGYSPRASGSGGSSAPRASAPSGGGGGHPAANHSSGHSGSNHK